MIVPPFAALVGEEGAAPAAGAAGAPGVVSDAGIPSGTTSPGAAWMVGVSVSPAGGGTSDFVPQASERMKSAPKASRVDAVIEEVCLALRSEGRW
jgi:hypothetical protein